MADPTRTLADADDALHAVYLKVRWRAWRRLAEKAEREGRDPRRLAAEELERLVARWKDVPAT